MELEVLKNVFNIYKLKDNNITLPKILPYFITESEDEFSLVCDNTIIPSNIVAKQEGYKAIKIKGELDFSLIGIIAEISTILSRKDISVFVVSSYNTDYILVRENKIEEAITELVLKGYSVSY